MSRNKDGHIKIRDLRRGRFKGTAPAKMCDCCGQKIVFLKKHDVDLDKTVWVVCYLRTWDGNPWYNSTLHTRHSRRRLALYFKERDEARQDPDPVFRLD